MMSRNILDLPSKPENTRVVVAMSGGVDSSVVAGLLKNAGYEVIGITLQLYNHRRATHRPGLCCAGKDVDDARMVCETLDIPHYVLDYKTRFYEKVIVPFAKSYSIGETPVPCITCNQIIKFADLLKTSKALGADALATGHYIRSIATANTSHRALFRPVDSERDQSYFLFSVTQDQINYLRFPLGGFQKNYVRELARTMGLAVANKRDSQDICFIQKQHYSSFIKDFSSCKTSSGEIVHINGKVLGQHDGLINFTIGQRKGLGVSVGEALYVIRLDYLTSRVIVGPYSALKVHRLWLRETNWLGDISPSEFPVSGIKLAARIRSTRPAKPAVLSYNNDIFQVEFPDGEYGIATGQACVLYSDQNFGSRILGGGFIANSE